MDYTLRNWAIIIIIITTMKYFWSFNFASLIIYLFLVSQIMLNKMNLYLSMN